MKTILVDVMQYSRRTEFITNDKNRKKVEDALIYLEVIFTQEEIGLEFVFKTKRRMNQSEVRLVTGRAKEKVKKMKVVSKKPIYDKDIIVGVNYNTTPIYKRIN